MDAHRPLEHTLTSSTGPAVELLAACPGCKELHRVPAGILHRADPWPCPSCSFVGPFERPASPSPSLPPSPAPPEALSGPPAEPPPVRAAGRLPVAAVAGALALAGLFAAREWSAFRDREALAAVEQARREAEVLADRERVRGLAAQQEAARVLEEGARRDAEAASARQAYEASRRQAESLAARLAEETVRREEAERATAAAAESQADDAAWRAGLFESLTGRPLEGSPARATDPSALRGAPAAPTEATPPATGDEPTPRELATLVPAAREWLRLRVALRCAGGCGGTGWRPCRACGPEPAPGRRPRRPRPEDCATCGGTRETTCDRCEGAGCNMAIDAALSARFGRTAATPLRRGSADAASARPAGYRRAALRLETLAEGEETPRTEVWLFELGPDGLWRPLGPS